MKLTRHYTAAQLTDLVTEAAVAGLNIVAEQTQATAVPLTPRHTEALRDSLAVIPASGDDLTSAVGSDSPYAVRQHEELNYRHDDGQAKYLETAVGEIKPTVEGIMAVQARKRLT